MLTPLLKAFLVAVFVALGLNAGRSNAGRRHINVFLLYTITLLCGTGLAQREVWPFTTWPLVAGEVPQLVDHPRIVAVDGNGNEHDIDYRAWAPLEFDELIGWTEKNFSALDPTQRDRVAGYLLSIVETARIRWLAGNADMRFERYLGVFSAPFFLGHPDRWTSPAKVPVSPFVGLRLYRERWNIDERANDPSRVVRVLAYEYKTR